MDKIKITHFSDILCIWAYISQIRIDELEREFKEHIEIDYCLFPVFGDVADKMQTQWQDKGGIAGYSQHVIAVAEQFEHLSLHPKVWQHNTPTSSLPAHLYLCAVKIAEQEGLLETGSFTLLKKGLRQAFFTDCLDVSRQQVLQNLLEQYRLPTTPIEDKIANGQAFATLSRDMQIARDLSVRASPTFIFNEDRQRLAGNVGYKIIEANVRELLSQPSNLQPWC